MQEFKQILTKLLEEKDLTDHEATHVMTSIMNGESEDIEISSFLTALRMKGESISEVTNFAQVMRDKSHHIHPNVEDIVDTCGTGGDSSGTFNISTTTAFVVAGAGVSVAKHGNRAASSQCGSADVLEEIGVNIDLTPEQVEKCIEEVGIGFLFAPLFHSSMKHVVKVRKKLQIRTVFNILGPLTNPASTEKQIIGVFDPGLTEFIAHVLKKLGSEHSMVVYGDGLDEITTTGKTKISELKDGEISTYELDPESLNIKLTTKEELKGGDKEKNAKILEDILKGEKSPKRDIVLLNSAAALIVTGRAKDFSEGIELAIESIDSGAALEKMDELIVFSKKN